MSEVGVLSSTVFLLLVMSFSDLDMCREDLELGNDDFRDRFDDCEGDLD